MEPRMQACNSRQSDSSWSGSLHPIDATALHCNTHLAAAAREESLASCAVAAGRDRESTSREQAGAAAEQCEASVSQASIAPAWGVSKACDVRPTQRLVRFCSPLLLLLSTERSGSQSRDSEPSSIIKTTPLTMLTP